MIGPRGGGKSFLAGFSAFLDSVRYDRHGARILGGSLAQADQIYNAISGFALHPGAAGIARSMSKTRAEFITGSEVSMLAASATSVRGPHVPTLKLDEVDEIDPAIRDAALGMCMARRGVPAMITLTSTWHRVSGPMSELSERARGGEFPLYTFCAFEVLERCPEGRSGPALERCPECPLVRWCHDVPPGRAPKAKRSSGHYAIESLVQKLRLASARTFEADYLCLGPRADGLWFPAFDPARHVRESAEYDPAWPVHLAIDSGVFTGAVFFQVRESGEAPVVTVFADYLAEGLTAEANARAIVGLAAARCNGRMEHRSTDPAGRARNAIGPSVVAEYERSGMKGIEGWPVRPVVDSLALVDSFLAPADGAVRLLIHPRCEHLVRAFRSYRRKKLRGQWLDQPEDPQHPAEDLIDALRGGLTRRWPDGRMPASTMPRVAARSVF